MPHRTETKTSTRPDAQGDGLAHLGEEASGSLLGAIVECSNDAILSATASGIVTTWNPAAERLFGYTAAEFIGKSCEALIPRDDRRASFDAFRRALDGEEIRDARARLLRKDGSVVHTELSLSTLRDRAGAILGVSAILRDASQARALRRELRRSGEKFRRIFQFSTDAISIASLETGRYLEVNDEFLRSTGLTRDQVIGKTPLELDLWCDPADYDRLAQQLFRAGTVRNRKTRFRATDGREIIGLLSALMIEIDGRQCALGVCRDITDQVRAEEGLRATEKRLGGVLANAPITVTAIDREGRITLSEGRGLEQLGVLPGQLVGRTIQEVFGAVPNILEIFLKGLEGTEFREIAEFAGRCYEVWFSSERNANGDLNGGIAVSTDITTRMRAEEELRRSEEYYRSVIECSSDVLLVIDQNSTIVFAGGSGRHELGYDVADLTGRSVLEFVHPDNLVEQAGLILLAFKELGPVIRSEARVRHKDGSWLTVEFAGRGTCDPTGKPIFVTTMRNITERKRAEVEIADARDAAVAASKAKSEFLSSMSHEIRTPMNAILGMADLLLETRLTTEQRRYLDSVMSNGNALLDLINGILDLAKVESGRMSLEQVAFDAVELAEEVADSLAVRTHEKGLELAVRCDRGLNSAVVGDPLRLRQVLVNLIGNAIKFTDQGEVLVTVEQDPRDAAPGALLFSVRDTGIGIATDSLAAVFSSFTQADSSTTRRYGGSGLGLAIVERLVGLMGGRVWVESEPARGSTFHFTARFGSVSAVNRVEHPPHVYLGGVRVLVVDDNSTNRSIVREALVARGAEVSEAWSPEAGLAAIERAASDRNPFRLVLVDCMAGGTSAMDGFAMVERLRASAYASEIVGGTIMMLGANTVPNALARMKELELSHYIVKPIKRSDLCEVAAQVLTRKHISKTEPLAEPPASRAVAEVSQVVGRPLRILLADDSSDNRMLICAYLKATPYELEEAENGKAALDKFITSHFDLVLMDIQMPVMDGYAAVAAMREWESASHRPRTPIIALTASALEETVRRALAAGCDQHVSKPVKKATLLEAIMLNAGRAVAADSDRGFRVDA